MDASVDDVGTLRAGQLAYVVAAARVGCVDADADDVTRLEGGRIETLEGFVGKNGIAPGCRRRGRQHVQPARGNERDAEGDVTRVDDMDSHLATVTHIRLPFGPLSGPHLATVEAVSVLVRRRWHDAVALAIWLCLLAPMWAGVSTAAAPQQASFNPLARQVEVIRTAYGVPHIYADNLRALGYALGYLQLEDYGDRVPLGLLRARGELARHVGRAALDSDFESRPYYLRAMDVYPQLAKDTRDVYEGFAGGVNRYIETHPDEFDGWDSPTFTGFDVAALYVYRPLGLARRWIRRLTESAEAPLVARGDGLLSLDGQVDEGSSSWALAPSRTTSGAAILLRNPHLSWQAGYWEAHVVVPGQLDFYGDFRIGAPLGIIGGFNRHLGFSTSNNDVNNGEAYALEVDPARADHYLLDGVSVPLRREYVTRPFRDGDDVGFETRERLFTDLGRVLHRDASRIYVLRSPEEGEFRAGEQFLRLIQARSLEEWKAALRIAAHPESNFTYADAEGNIFYIWNAVLPVRPHPAGEIAPVPVERSEQMWTAVHSLDELPQLLNPAGGYVRNENDAPWLTNLRQPLNPRWTSPRISRQVRPSAYAASTRCP